MTQDSINPFAVWIAGSLQKALEKKRAKLQEKHEKLEIEREMRAIDRMYEIIALDKKIEYVVYRTTLAIDSEGNEGAALQSGNPLL